MMTKTALSDGRRTRPRFAAPTPAPPKFLIGTDDPARIGILPVLRREGSDQRESKGFGWDPAKTLRMAEPPEFLIGTIEQSENHSTPSQQTTYPNPNGHKIRFSHPPQRTEDSPSRTRLPHPPPLSQPPPRLAVPRIPRPPSGLLPLVYPERRRDCPASRRAQTHPRTRTSGRGFISSIDNGQTRPLPLALAHPRNVDSPQRTRLPRPPWQTAVSRISRPRPLFGLIPFVQPHPRKLSGLSQSPSLAPLVYPEGRRASPASRRTQPHPRNLDSPQQISRRWLGSIPLAQFHPRKPFPVTSHSPLITEFLIANLELEFRLTHTKLSPLEISNREYFAVFHSDFGPNSTRPLGAAAGGDPVEEALHAGPLAPHQSEEFPRIEIGGFVAEKCFHAPLDVGGGPGAETVTLRDDPVVAEGVQHVAAEIGNGKIEIGKRVAQRGLRGDGRIGAGAIGVQAITSGTTRRR